MGDFLTLLDSIHKDSEQFSKLVIRMEPLISKYVRLLYKDEKEDIHSELVLALWEAVTKLKYVKNEGQCIKFLSNALRNRFYELYRNSKKVHDNQFASETEILETTVFEERQYEDLIMKIDLKEYLRDYTGLRYQIYNIILFDNLTDYEIAKKYDVTRQYVHRLKKQLYSDLKEKYF